LKAKGKTNSRFLSLGRIYSIISSRRRNYE
jgi:hypothetical protein